MSADVGAKDVTLTLNAWINLATEGLGEEAKRRVRAEITSHYDDHIASLLASDSTQEEAHKAVIAALGEPQIAAKALRKSYLTDWQERFMVQLRTLNMTVVFWLILASDGFMIASAGVAFATRNGIRSPLIALFALPYVLPYFLLLGGFHKVLMRMSTQTNLSVSPASGKCSVCFSIAQCSLLFLYLSSVFTASSSQPRFPGFAIWVFMALAYLPLRSRLFGGHWRNEPFRQVLVATFGATLVSVAIFLLWRCLDILLLLLFAVVPGFSQGAGRMFSHVAESSGYGDSFFLGALVSWFALETAVGLFILRKWAKGVPTQTPQHSGRSMA